MTGPALNSASIAAAGAASPGVAGSAHAAGKATGPLGGFEALIAALFPQTEPGAADKPGATPPKGAFSAGKAAADPETPAADTPAEPEADAAADPALTTDLAAAGDAVATALTASLVAQPTAVLASEATPPAQPAETEAPADPLLKARGNPSFPFLSRPGVDAKAKTDQTPATATDDTTTEGDDAALEPELPPGLAKAALGSPQVLAHQDKAAPLAWGRDKAPGAPAQPALDHANAKADLARKAAEPPPAREPAPAAPPAAASPASETAAAPAAAVAATLTPPPIEPQAPTTAPGKTAKAEKAKGPAAAAAPAAADAPKAAAAANKPNAVDAVDGAPAKPAHAEADAVESKSREAKAAAPSEAVDAGAPGETRAATQAAQPATHTAHAVRGAPETVANLAAQILKKLEGKTTRFDVELDPQGLGKVDVRVEIGATGQITAAMTFDNPGAAAEVKARAAELQKALEQAGFDLSGGSLSFDVADQGQGQGWQGPAWANPDDSSGRAFRGQAFRAALDTAGEAADAAANGALRLTRRAASGLDLRI